MSRITPAYAGNTQFTVCKRQGNRDHPRLRGEHMNSNVSSALSPGSPPPTRGTHENISNNGLYTGITPAYAGNTEAKKLLAKQSQDHPRLRGEHLLRWISLTASRGSPPPTRGTRGFRKREALYTGITPAYAGNTDGN